MSQLLTCLFHIAAAVAAAAQYQRQQAARAARALDNARAHAVNPMQNFNFEEFMLEAQLANNQRGNAEQRASEARFQHLSPSCNA